MRKYEKAPRKQVDEQLAPESVADKLGLREAYFQFLVKVRVHFRHCLRLVGHPRKP